MLTIDEMAETFGANPVATCTRVTEELTQKDGKSQMTRTFSFADGSEETIHGLFQVNFPAAPGWVLMVVKPPNEGTTTIVVVEHRPVFSWHYERNIHGDWLFPKITGEIDYADVCSIALQAPDGRVVELLRYWETWEGDRRGIELDSHSFESANEWLAWGRPRWAERVEAERNRKQLCPHCSRSADT